MKKRFLSLLVSVCAIFSTFAGCNFALGGGNESTSSSSLPEKVDYVAQTTLDMNSASAKLTITPNDAKGEKTFMHIDGDTTHFTVPKSFDSSGTFKARYLAVDTPESTGDIEEWGKKASAFTKEKLFGAEEIVLEANSSEWSRDTNQRYLSWVWYKTEGTDTFRLLNLELLQEGLAVASTVENSLYNAVCQQAAGQAQEYKLHIHSGEKDPDFYYGDAIQTTLKEVRTNLDQYTGKRVAIYGIVTAYKSKGSIYIEYYDEEDNRTYGLPIFYGLNHPTFDPLFAVGNEVRIVGEVTKSDTFGYQMSGLKYEFMRPNDPENIRVISKNNVPVYATPTVEEFMANNYEFAEEHLYSSISMEGLKVVRTYTTSNGGKSDGAMTLTCEDANGKRIEVRTGVLTDENGETVVESAYKNKTINVRGVIETYDGDYQINVFATKDIDVID